jgi:HEAT repeat protein
MISSVIQKTLRDLADPDPDVRIAAADAIGQSPALHEDISWLPEAVAPLSAALADSDRGVRMSAAYALGSLGLAEAAEPLIGLLDATDDRGVQLVILKSLGKIGAAEVRDRLERVRAESDSRCVRAVAARALERIANSG